MALAQEELVREADEAGAKAAVSFVSEFDNEEVEFVGCSVVVGSDGQQFFVPLSTEKDWKSNGKEFLQILLILEEFLGFFISLAVYCGEFLRKGDFGCWDQCRSTGNLEWEGLCYWGRQP